MTDLNSHESWWLEWALMGSNKDDLTTTTLVIPIVILGVLWYKLSLPATAPPLPPGPRSLPIVGYLPFLRRDLHNQLSEMANTYGPIFKFYIGSKLHVVVNTPELAKVVVRDHDETFANRDLTVVASVVSYRGQNLIFQKNNAAWRNLRKIFVSEILSNKNLKACSSFRRDGVRKTIKNVFSKIGTNVNISEVALLTEADVITRMIWDDSLYKGEKGIHFGIEIQKLLSEFVKMMGQPNLSDMFPYLAWLDLQGIERKIKKEHKKLDQLLTRIIQDRIESNSQNPRGEGEHEGKKDFLQILLDLMDQEDTNSLNITQVKALISDFMIAGTETTTTVIEWAMANIMRNHKVMKRVQEELTEVVGLNYIVEESHLPKLQYLDAVFKETLRLYPVAPILLPRVPSKDCVIDGYSIPKGCTVFLNVLLIHRNPRYWDNPLEFNPERFLATDGTNRWDYNGNDLRFFPFGSGRRACPGVPLAQKMQMFILASLLHSFDWRLPKGEEHDLSENFGITLKKRKPLIAVPHQRLPDASLYM